MELWKQPLYISELPQTSNSAIPQCIIPQFHISTILHDGFGQDDEWVAANFTNATEIAAAGGYAAWVDAQVGEGLTNGLYKLTVTVAEDPPEVVNLCIGDSSVAIAAAGEYVFLLGKGVRYPFSASSDIANGFQYSVVDDVPAAALRGSPTRSANQGGAGHWVPDLPRIMLPPMYGYVLFEPFLSVIPSKWTPSEFTPSMTFTPDDDSGLSMTNSTSVVFVEWENQARADWPIDRRRKTIGVCEDIFLYFRPFVAQISLSSSMSDSVVISEPTYNRWRYSAPGITGLDVIRERHSGDIVTFSVLPPTGYTSRLVAIDNHQTVKGAAGGFRSRQIATTHMGGQCRETHGNA